ncbi:uncharacterized protein LOC130928961 isoform X2 [Corythoichthys intestinalis]|uniref:uncharacterized protein LOC130928961 isoform X2 n=1 Tax=Corythoichthys intestinalis TaxID=161448 RepID=UPI0025A5A832|nr:uncharacterized protein LOC130928961 isoform X2 [Corythoichthys intestinalis]
MRARTTPAAKFEAELCGAKDLRQHQRSASCKMQVKVVPRTLTDLCVSQAHHPEPQVSAFIKEEEEEESPYIKEEEDFVPIKDSWCAGR